MSRIQIGTGFGGAAAIIAGGLVFLLPAPVDGAIQPTPAVGTRIDVVNPSPARMCPAIDVVPQCIPQQTSESSTTDDGSGNPHCDGPAVAAGVKASIGNADGHVACGPAVATTDWNDIGGGCLQLRESRLVACAG
jgi:hypothetical protein